MQISPRTFTKTASLALAAVGIRETAQIARSCLEKQGVSFRS
jgi:hypothetical protein